MNLRRINAVFKKEFIHIIRDRKSLIASILIPVLLLILFGWALNLDVDNIDVAICDYDNSINSRDLVSRIENSRFFNVKYKILDQDKIDKYILASRVAIGIIIPQDFSKKLSTNKETKLGVFIDGSDANRASIGLGYLNAMSIQFSNELLRKKLISFGVKKLSPPIDLRQIVWFNSELESKNYIIPGLIAVIMSVIAALLTSLTISREWERGTMEQLISTPIRGYELIIGKLMPYIVLGFINITFCLIMGIFVFEVPFRGSLLTLYGITFIFLIAANSLGILISIVTRNQLLSYIVALVSTFLPAFLLSGFSFSIANMPQPLQYASRLFVATYFVKIVKGIFLKGVTLQILFTDTLFLCGYCIILFVISIIKFKKRLT